MDKREVIESQANGSGSRDSIQQVLAVSEVSDKALIELLREKGVQDLEAASHLQEWCMRRESAAEQAEDYPRAQIQIMIDRARLYYEAGLLDDAKQDYLDALEYANYMNMNGVSEEIRREMAQRNF